jgi:hypothetical protein
MHTCTCAHKQKHVADYIIVFIRKAQLNQQSYGQWTIKWALYEALVGIQCTVWAPHLNLHVGTMSRIYSTFSSHALHGENVLTPQNDKGDIKQINMIIRSGHSKLCKFSAVHFGVKSLYKLKRINSYLSRLH